MPSRTVEPVEPVEPAPAPAAADDLVAAFLDAGRALVGIAVHSVNAAPVDITVTQYRLLAVLAAEGPRTIGQVAASLGVAQSNATRHCDRLQRLELLQRSRASYDRRVVLAELTVSGRRLVDYVTELRRREIAAVLGSLSRAQQARALRAVTEFNKAAAALGGHPWLSAAW